MKPPSSTVPVHTSEATLAPVVSAMPGGLPTLDQLFAFAADAERRARTLRLRIEDRSVTTSGESLTRTEILVDRPRARVTTSTVKKLNCIIYQVFNLLIRNINF